MNAFSNKYLTTIENVNLRQIRTLLIILKQSVLRDRQFIAGRYRNHAQHFDETLRFAEDLGWLKDIDDKLVLSRVGSSVISSMLTDEHLVQQIISAMKISNYRTLLITYLLEFRVSNGSVVQHASVEARIQQSAIRNFLIDMRVISYVPGYDRFLLESGYVDLYLWAKNARGPRNRRLVEEESHAREQFGLSAEVAVYQYERSRVGMRLASWVHHVSAEFPFSSYDIESVTETESGISRRYIEVKAVSEESYDFFWTSSELEAAQLLEDRYFLYLLPVAAGQFDFSKLLILRDAYNTVYRNLGAWLIEVDVILCRKKERTSTALSA